MYGMFKKIFRITSVLVRYMDVTIERIVISCPRVNNKCEKCSVDPLFTVHYFSYTYSLGLCAYVWDVFYLFILSLEFKKNSSFQLLECDERRVATYIPNFRVQVLYLWNSREQQTVIPISQAVNKKIYEESCFLKKLFWSHLANHLIRTALILFLNQSCDVLMTSGQKVNLEHVLSSFFNPSLTQIKYDSCTNLIYCVILGPNSIVAVFSIMTHKPYTCMAILHIGTSWMLPFLRIPCGQNTALTIVLFLPVNASRFLRMKTLVAFVSLYTATVGRGRPWKRMITTQSKWLRSLTQADQLDKARLLAAASPKSGSWLEVLPVPNLGTRLDDEAFRSGIGLRIGAALCQPHKCRCGSTVDAQGLHPLSCKYSEGRFPRHGAINDIDKRALGVAGFPLQLEPVGLDRGDRKTPDGLTTFPYKMGKSMVWDVTVVDSYAATSINASAIKASSAAANAEEAKSLKYAALSQRYIFEGLAFEISGALGPNAARVINEIGDMMRRSTGEPRRKTWLHQQIGLAIVRGNALSILSAGAPLT
ncbi:hypothetical protein GQR58_023221 [Nymphon striatum]|nr:hypothetical protein GQR58_023221 [Nymphon striatum]